MTLKLAVTITADFSELKSEATGGTASIETLGAAANSVAAEIGKIDVALSIAGRGATAIAPVSQGLDEIAKGATRAGDALRAPADRLDALRAAFDPTFASAQRLTQELDGLAELERAGIQITGGYTTALDKLIVKYDQSAAAAKRAAAEREAFLGLGRAERTAATAQSAFSAPATFGRAGPGSNWLSYQRASPARSARDAAGAFDDLFAQQDNLEKMATQAAKLRAELDPVTAAQARFTEEVARFHELQAAGIIDSQEVIGLTALRTKSLDKEVDDLKRVQSATGLAAHEMGNLQYQLNDIVTMGLMGASPFQILASQGGQVYQVLAGSSGGVTGAIKGIGEQLMSVARWIGPLNLGLIGLGAAGAGAAYLIGRSFPSATAVAEKHEAVIERATARYSGLSDAIERMRRESANAVSIDVSIQIEDAEQLFRSQMEGLADYSLPGGLRDWTSALQPISAEVRSFMAEIEAGTGSVLDMREQLRALYRQAGTTDEMRAGIKAFLTMTESAAETEQQLNELGVTTRTMSSEFIRFQRSTEIAGASLARMMQAAPSGKTQVQQLTEDFERWQVASKNLVGPSPVPDLFARALAEIARGPREAAEEAERRLANLRLAPSARQLAELRQAADAEIAEMERVQGSAEAVAERRRQLNAETAAAQIEISREEEARRAGYALDLQAVTARTAAAKASIESERVRIDLMAQGFSATEAAARATEAYTLAITQSSAEWTKAAEARKFAREDALANAQAQVDSFGMTAGAAQAYGQAIQQLTAYRRAAAEAGMPIDPAEEQAIRDAASAAGSYTDALARMNMERDQAAQIELLRGEARLVGLSENARSIAMAGLQAEADLRRQNLSTTDEQGQAYIRNAQTAAGMRVEIDRQTDAYDRQHSVLENVASTFIDMLDPSRSESFFDGMMKGLADISRQFAELGKQKILETILGPGTNYTTGAMAVGQRSTAPAGAAIAANQAVSSSAFAPIPTQRPEFVGQAAAAVSGQVLTYAGRFNKAVDGRLMTILETAATRFPLQVEAISGLRPGDKRFHGRGLAADVQIYGSEGQRYGNYQNARDFRVYEQFAQEARRAQRELFPELDKLFRWGGYFSGGKGKYGALDSMHFDLGGAGMGGGTWEGGLTASQRRLWAGAESVGMGGSSAAIERAVQSGTTNALRSAVTGTSSYSGGAVPLPTARPSFQTPGVQMTGAGVSGGLFGQGGRLQSMLSSPFGQGAMNALGAFGAGQQGGSLSGAFSGGLGAIGMGLGPVGIVAGIGAGLLGGLFGGRQRRKQEHEQRAQAWAAQAQEWQAYQDEVRTGMGPTSGLRASQSQMAGRLTGFVQTGSAAWKNGTNNSSALFGQVGDELGQYFARTNAAFGRAFESNVRSLQQGQGLDGPFVRAVKGVSEAGKGLLTFVDDTRVVFGDGSEEVARAAAASVESLKQMLSGGRELTEVEEALETLRGAGSAVRAEMVALGVSMEDAAREVDHTTAIVIKRIGDDLVRGIEDELAALDGKSYLADFREFFTSIDARISSLLSVGADRSGADRLFVKRAQDMVDGAELTGDAFQELLRIFPRLNGVVREFSEAAEEATKRTADQLATLRESIEDRLFDLGNDTSTLVGALARQKRTAAREIEAERKAGGEALLDLERLHAAQRQKIMKDFADRSAEEARQALENATSYLASFGGSIKRFLDDLAAGPDSTLSNKDRAAEARRQFDEQLTLARTGDRDALDNITSYAGRLIDADEAWNASATAHQDTLAYVRQMLADLPKRLRPEDLIDKAIRDTAAGTQEAIRAAAMDLGSRITADFDRIDTNLDGLLSFDELRLGLGVTEAELRRIWSEIDVNGDGQISKLESLLASDGLTRSTLSASFASGPAATAGALAPHFTQLDRSVNGLLDFDEMKAALGGVATDAQIRAMMAEMDFNGDLQISKLEALLAAEGVTRSALTSALAAGPEATARLTAGALAGQFSQLDRSVNGLLDFNEMKLALGGVATDAQIRQMMNVLDANGDGQISQLELMNATGRTQSGSLSDMQRLTNLVWQTGVNSAAYQERTRHYTELSYGVLGTISSTLSSSLSMQERIRANLAEDNGSRGLRQFAMGGISSVPAIFGEAGPEAAVPLPDGRTIPVTLSMPRLPAVGANQNAGVLDIAPIVRALEAIQGEMRRLQGLTENAIGDAAAEIADPLDRFAANSSRQADAANRALQAARVRR